MTELTERPAPGTPFAGSAPPLPANATKYFDYLRALVSRRSAIVIESGKEYLVESKLSNLARRTGHPTAWAMLDALMSAPEGPLHDEVVDAMTTNETSFFRDPPVFDTLSDVVIPDLVRRHRADRRLTIWSAACSSGQEPYSLAILLKEKFPELSSWQVRIVATDISSSMVEKAKSGKFTRLEVNRGLPAPLLLKHFDQKGMEWEIDPRLREPVTFRQLNLARPFPVLPPMDLVMLRNVLIYFSVADKQKVLERMRDVLRPGGYLVLGTSESTVNLDRCFERLSAGTAGVHRLTVPEEGPCR